jgi:hypothetical protein
LPGWPVVASSVLKRRQERFGVGVIVAGDTVVGQGVEVGVGERRGVGTPSARRRTGPPPRRPVGPVGRRRRLDWLARRQAGRAVAVIIVGRGADRRVGDRRGD